MRLTHSRRCERHGFTLVEVLVTISVIALLIGLLVPGLAHARHVARGLSCGAQQRGLVQAWTMYANDFCERAMPLAYTSAADVGPGGMARYWWGSHGTASTPPEFEKGFIAGYLDASLAERSVFECAAQAFGTYTPQGPGARWPTSTYGYNGYFLTPSRTPGYDAVIGNRPWQRLGDLRQPSALIVFADTMIRQGNILKNSALLDPPVLYIGSNAWAWNGSPTTAFRHSIRRTDGRGSSTGTTASTSGGGATGRAMTARGDGSVSGVRANAGWLVPGTFLGSVLGDGLAIEASGSAGDGVVNEGHYVPDASSW